MPVCSAPTRPPSRYIPARKPSGSSESYSNGGSERFKGAIARFSTMRTLRGMLHEAAIEVRELRKAFGDVQALCGIDLSAAAGTILGLLGPNGAGKTTAVRILTTLLPPDGGTARVAGLDVVKDAAALRARIGLAGQYAAVDENLTGFENLDMVGRLYHLGRRTPRERAP